MDLKCKKMDCKHNDGCACMSKKISICTNCECGTYEKTDNLDKTQMQDISRDMFEVAPDLHPFRHNKEVYIECSAECLFNKNGKCKSNGISVMNGSNAGVCITNIEP